MDLSALVRRAAEDHRALVAARGIALTLRAPGRPILLPGDDTRLAQVIGNLLHNAARFTPAGGRVTLSADAEDGAATLRVADTGAGRSSW